jgi:hypothetical protein
MEEAKQVIARLERIEGLRRAQAPATVLLAEVRSLLAEGERWLAAERGVGLENARSALDRCRVGLEEPGEVMPRPAL